MAASLPYQQQQRQPDQKQQFSLTFRKPDRIQVISNCGSGPLELTRQTVFASYSPGITSVNAKKHQPGQAWTLKLNDSPFARGSNSQLALAARQLACDLVLAAWRAGWELAAAPIVTNLRDAATWFFRRRPPTSDPDAGASFKLCCVTISRGNSLRLIRFPPVLAEQVVQLIGSLWPAGVQGSSSDLRLLGHPWFAQKSEGVLARRLVLRLVEFMRLNGWQLLTSARIKDSSDSLYFCCQQEGQGFAGSPLSPQPQQLMLLSLHDKQSIRMEGGNPDADGPWLVETLQRLWHCGVQSRGDYYGAFDIRLGGSPWLPSERNSKSLSRQLIARLLGQLRTRGWKVLHSLDISRRYPVIKSAFLFVRAEPEPEPVPHCCFWTSVPNKLCFIDVPNSLLESSISLAHANARVVSQKAKDFAFVLKFRGRACAKIEWRCLLADLLEKFVSSGWSLACTGNVSGRFYSDDNNSYSLEAHSWWFTRPGLAERKAREAFDSQPTSELNPRDQGDNLGSAPFAEPRPPPSYDLLFGPPTDSSI